MELNEKVEDILLKLNNLTGLEVIVTDEKKVLYYIGNIDECEIYLHNEISNDLKELGKTYFEAPKIYKNKGVLKLISDEKEENKKETQIIYSIYQNKKLKNFFIFLKRNGELDNGDMGMINSSMYLIKKFFA